MRSRWIVLGLAGLTVSACDASGGDDATTISTTSSTSTSTSASNGSGGSGAGGNGSGGGELPPSCYDGPPNASIAAQAPATWVAVPGSKLEDVCACANGFPEVCGVEYCGGLVSYSGAAYSECRNQLFVWGGGHNAYYGNEIYVFDVPTLTWSRLNDPSPPTSTDNCVEALSDGAPNSRHTYDGLAFIEHADRLFAAGGAIACEAGGGGNAIWLFDATNLVWELAEPTPVGLGPDEPHGYFPFNYAADYDPVSRNVYLETTYGLYAYSYDDDTLTRVWDLYSGGGVWTERTGVVVPERRWFVSIGTGRVAVYDLEAPNLEIWSTSGPQAIADADAPGIAYDRASGTIVGWTNGDVYRLDLDSRTWASLGSVYVPQGIYGQDGDVYGRFAYLPVENAFVAVADPIDEVHVLKNR